MGVTPTLMYLFYISNVRAMAIGPSNFFRPFHFKKRCFNVPKKKWRMAIGWIPRCHIITVYSCRTLHNGFKFFFKLRFLFRQTIDHIFFIRCVILIFTVVKISWIIKNSEYSENKMQKKKPTKNSNLHVNFSIYVFQTSQL